MPSDIPRYQPDIDFGLSEEQVRDRKNKNLVNNDTSVPTKTILRIIKDNLFTLFNLINFGYVLF